MAQPHRYCYLARREGNPLDRANTYVARGEYARQACLQGVRARGTPSQTFLSSAERSNAFPVGIKPSSSSSTPLPAGVGIRADEHEDGSRGRGGPGGLALEAGREEGGGNEPPQRLPFAVG